tara:strand:- start:177113 stop:177772 length:660 start_codon:yes stop_codon:yes gene_type:complete
VISAYLFIKEESERVPNKNFVEVGGKPLFQWIIETLQKVNRIDQIVINTDAPQILSSDLLKASHKFQVIEREEKLRGNKITANQLIESDIEKFSNKLILNVHVTTPFLSVETIDKGIDLILNSSSGSIFGVNEIYHRFYDSKLNPVNHDPKDLVPTQQLSPLYMENSSLYIFKKESFEKHGNRIGPDSKIIEVPKLEALDIDTEEDLILAKAYANYLKA